MPKNGLVLRLITLLEKFIIITCKSIASYVALLRNQSTTGIEDPFYSHTPHTKGSVWSEDTTGGLPFHISNRQEAITFHAEKDILVLNMLLVSK
jgi:hypothetical protein